MGAETHYQCRDPFEASICPRGPARRVNYRVTLGKPKAASRHFSRRRTAQLLGQTGKAKSYAERLFAFVSIGRLDKDAATKAPCVPAEKAGSTFNPDALAEILRQTDRYPYFPQESGSEMLRTQENGDDGTGGCARESHSQSAGELRCDAPRRREAERYQGGVLAPPLSINIMKESRHERASQDRRGGAHHRERKQRSMQNSAPYDEKRLYRSTMNISGPKRNSSRNGVTRRGRNSS